MGRPKATYGRKAANRQIFEADCFESSSSPAKSPEHSAITPVQLPSPRIKKHKARVRRIIDSDSSKSEELLSKGRESRELQPSQHEEHDQNSPNSPVGNTRSRKALQVRDANAVVDQSRLRHKSQPVVTDGYDCSIKRAPSAVSGKANLPSQQNPTLATRELEELQKDSAAHPEGVRNREPKPNFEASPLSSQTQPSANSDEFSKHAESLLSLSSDSNLVPFTNYADALSAHFQITKLAEASYGEVYRLSLLPSTTTQLRANFSHTDESVLKLIALKPPSQPPPSSKITIDGKQRRRKQWTKNEQNRIESMSRIEDVSSEVRLLKHMSCVPGFTNFRALTVLRGPLPPPFSSAWHDYNNNVKESEFPDPLSSGAYFGRDQLWAMIEMQDAGRDLEAIIMKSVWSVWDGFWGIAIAMAKGEEWAKYEHRDLHLGNVCVKWSDTDTIDSEDINAVPKNIKKRLGFTGLETTIIDYTLSRADMNPETATKVKDISESLVQAADDDSYRDLPSTDDVAFLDLSLDPSLFQGDAEEEYQYEIYRCMRSAVFFANPVVSWPDQSATKKSAKKVPQANKLIDETQIWRQSHPLTNLVWLHFVLFKLCEGVEIWPSSNKRLYGSRPIQKHAMDLENKLWLLSSILELENLNRGPDGEPNGLISCTDLVSWAVQEGWLGEDDVTACGLGKDEDEETLLEMVENLTIDPKEERAAAGAKVKAKEKKRRTNKY